MKYQLLIDGYNLLFQNPELRKILERDLEKARRILIDQLEEYAGKNSLHILIVFDGDIKMKFRDESRSHVEVCFSKSPEKADPLIKRLLEKTKKNQDLTVVTSDNEIGNYAKLCEVSVTSSQKFAEQISTHFFDGVEKKYFHSMTNAELTEWMGLFGDREDISEK
jgi:predicted RNA-binding protein with PIN domain